MKLVTSETMRQMDKAAIEGENIPSEELMENAGLGIAQAIMADFLIDEEELSFTIFCGKGNNGGDGFVIGRHLFKIGCEVEFYCLASKDNLSKDSQLNFIKAEELGIPIYEISELDDLPLFLDSDFIIDAIFGTGFSSAPRDLSAELIEYINDQPQTVIAVDMPSGLNADNGKHEGVVVDADYTYTLAQPKYGLFVSPGRELSGLVDIIPIGIPEDVTDKFKVYDNLISHDFVSDSLPERDPEGHKGTFGKLFILGGGLGMTGASALAGKSALRSGCGLVKIGCPKTTLPIVASQIIEATTHPLPDVAKKGVLALRGLGEIKKVVAEHDALVIGPGIGIHHETKELLIRLLLSIDKPTVLDADGLNNISKDLSVLEDTSADLILTPHPGEFFRMTGIEVPADIHKRIEIAREFAIKYQTILVLKGSPTLVANVDGMVYLNPTGNNGMATGGSGDVLSGIIGSLLVQKMEPIDAAVCGVFIHGVAGDNASYELGDRSLIASDIIDYLGDAFLELY